jgi:hypothetical protein
VAAYMASGATTNVLLRQQEDVNQCKKHLQKEGDYTNKKGCSSLITILVTVKKLHSNDCMEL